MKKLLPPSVFFAGAAACLLQAWRSYPLLPDRVASHFGLSGAPDGWMPKRAFVGFEVGVVLLLGAALLAASRSLSRRTNERLNLPHKDYWLAPERREATLAYFREFFLWFGAGTYAVLFDLFRQTDRVNLGLAKGLAHPLATIAAYVAFALVLIVAMNVRFRRVPPGA
ncbi:MAG: DUF1648 domain-containing protein [Elusimicrobia bacterium]|nr:DUF1648 domain-containing protein [Elusimicrobiota bacterium]